MPSNPGIHVAGRKNTQWIGQPSRSEWDTLSVSEWKSTFLTRQPRSTGNWIRQDNGREWRYVDRVTQKDIFYNEEKARRAFWENCRYATLLRIYWERNQSFLTDDVTFENLYYALYLLNKKVWGYEKMMVRSLYHHILMFYSEPEIRWISYFRGLWAMSSALNNSWFLSRYRLQRKYSEYVEDRRTELGHSPNKGMPLDHEDHDLFNADRFGFRVYRMTFSG